MGLAQIKEDVRADQKYRNGCHLEDGQVIQGFPENRIKNPFK